MSRGILRLVDDRSGGSSRTLSVCQAAAEHKSYGGKIRRCPAQPRALRLGLDCRRHPCCRLLAEGAYGGRTAWPAPSAPQSSRGPRLGVKPRRLRCRPARPGSCAPPDPAASGRPAGRSGEDPVGAFARFRQGTETVDAGAGGDGQDSAHAPAGCMWPGSNGIPLRATAQATCRSLRAAAQRATFFGLPAARSRP
jgi:hypothetical protein